MDKATLSSKLKNFWYYHKWHFLVGVFLVVVAIVGIRSCQNRENPDLHVLFAKYDNQIPLQAAELETYFASMVDDVNGDGESTALVTATTIVNGDRSDSQAMLAQVNFGDAVLYMLSDETYTILHDNGVLMDLSDLGTDDFLKGDRYYLSDSGALQELEHFKNDKKPYYLAIRKVDGTALEDSKEHQEQLKLAKDLIKQLLER